jgi:membrane protease YdiL (CAAX protease family)
MANQEELTVPPPAWPTPLAPQEPKEGFFTGRFGLRAGWGILIYLVTVIALIVFLSLAVLAATGRLKPMIVAAMKAKAAQSQHAGAPSTPPKPAASEAKPGGPLINESLQFLCTLAAAFLLSKIERRPLSVYGIGPTRIRDALPGGIVGLVALSILVGALYVSHHIVFDNLALTLPAALHFGAEWLLVFLFVGLFEEYLFRGYIQHALTRGFYGLGEKISPDNPRPIAFLFAAIVSSAFFFVAHLGNSGENAAGLFAVFLAGVVFAYALWRTGSLWWGIGFHMTWDWAQSFLYGTPDSGNVSAGRLLHTHPVGSAILSGGSDGPEGSALVIPVLLLVLIAIRLTPSGPQPSLEQLPQPKSLLPEETHVIV